jgi:beta-glucanase (GH16 family)
MGRYLTGGAIMKNLIIFIVLSLVFVFSISMAPRPKLYVMNDEFNVEQLDATKWLNEGWVQEVSTISPGNVSVHNGRLYLEGEANGDGTYTTAAVGTIYCQSYGKWEARIKFPAGIKGLWPCLWLIPQTYPASMVNQKEVLIAEWFGAWPTYMTVAYFQNDGTSHYPPTYAQYPQGQFAEVFRVYSVELRPNFCSIKYDGVEVYRWDGVVEDVLMRLVIQFAVSGTDPAGPPDSDEGFPQFVEVDWVRIYP